MTGRRDWAVGQPTVSAIIPAYNAVRTISGAIESCLSQTYPPIEILVVDDGSVDGTAELAAGFGTHVRVERKPNGGPASARNHAARLARGDWLGFLDADDRWLPSKLEKQLTLASSDDVVVIQTLTGGSTQQIPEEVTFPQLWETNLVCTSSALIRRSTFERLGGFNEDPELISSEDYHLWLRIAATGRRILTYPEFLIEWTRGRGLSSNLPVFGRAQLRNLTLIAKELDLPPESVRRKRLQIYDEIGRDALYQREMSLARSKLTKAFRIHPSPSRAFLLVASLLPVSVINLRRRWKQRRLGVSIGD
jgi:cellulose synthase/poly-beta-1,6-N-acetylglucosamine synthase-like glycosyltransferase